MDIKTSIGTLVLLALLLSNVGCNEGGGSNSASAAVSAKNIIFRNSAKASSASGDQVLKEGSVYAENVILETAANALSSTNLQDALDNELAIDLSAFLPGTVWAIENKDDEVQEGHIIFGNGVCTIDSGYLAAARLAATDATYYMLYFPDPVQYEILGNGVLYFSGAGQMREGSGTLPLKAVVAVISRNKTTMILTGYDHVSILTRIQ